MHLAVPWTKTKTFQIEVSIFKEVIVGASKVGNFGVQNDSIKLQSRGGAVASTLCECVTKGGLTGCECLHDTVETHFHGLEALHVNEETYASIVVPVLLEKIPQAVRLNMVRASINIIWSGL